MFYFYLILHECIVLVFFQRKFAIFFKRSEWVFQIREFKYSENLERNIF